MKNLNEFSHLEIIALLRLYFNHEKMIWENWADLVPGSERLELYLTEFLRRINQSKIEALEKWEREK